MYSPSFATDRSSPAVRPYQLFSDAAYLSLCDAVAFGPEVRQTIRTETLVNIAQYVWVTVPTLITPAGKSYLAFDLNGVPLIAFDETRNCRAIDVGLHDEVGQLIGISPEAPHLHRFTFRPSAFGGWSIELE